MVRNDTFLLTKLVCPVSNIWSKQEFAFWPSDNTPTNTTSNLTPPQLRNGNNPNSETGVKASTSWTKYNYFGHKISFHVKF